MSYNGLPQLRHQTKPVLDSVFTYVRKYVTLVLVPSPSVGQDTLAATRGNIGDKSRSTGMHTELTPPSSALKALAVRKEITQLEKSLQTMNDVNRAFETGAPIALEQLGFTPEHVQHLSARAATGRAPFPSNVITNLIDTIHLVQGHLAEILNER